MTDAYGQADALVEEVDADAFAADLSPFETLNEAGTADILLVCDHASNVLPVTYGTLGLDPELLSRHIGVRYRCSGYHTAYVEGVGRPGSSVRLLTPADRL